MNYSALASAALLLAGSATSQAALSVFGINFGDTGRVLADASGAPLTTPNVIRVGYFNDPTADAAVLSSSNFSAIDALFKPVGEGLTNGGTATTITATNGLFAFNIANIQQSYLPAGKLMFLWAFNAATPATATQWALFTNNDTSGGGSPWLSPLEDTGIPGSGDMTLSVQVDRVDDASDVVKGSLSGNQLRLAPIPEPSLLALLLTAVPLLARRRRPGAAV